MGGGGGGHGGITYKGVTIHQPKRWHTVTGKGMCAMMWAGDILGKAMTIIPVAMSISFGILINRSRTKHTVLCWRILVQMVFALVLVC